MGKKKQKKAFFSAEDFFFSCFGLHSRKAVASNRGVDNITLISDISITQSCTALQNAASSFPSERLQILSGKQNITLQRRNKTQTKNHRNFTVQTVTLSEQFKVYKIQGKGNSDPALGALSCHSWMRMQPALLWGGAFTLSPIPVIMKN